MGVVCSHPQVGKDVDAFALLALDVDIDVLGQRVAAPDQIGMDVGV